MSQNGQPNMGTGLQTSVLDTALADLNDLKARLGDVERKKLDLHVASIREVEKQITGMGTMQMGAPASCGMPTLDLHGADGRNTQSAGGFSQAAAGADGSDGAGDVLWADESGGIQASQHTSELSMSHFMEDAELHNQAAREAHEAVTRATEEPDNRSCGRFPSAALRAARTRIPPGPTEPRPQNPRRHLRH